MKKGYLGYLITGIVMLVVGISMMSMTISDASKDKRFKASNGVILSVPAKPKSTVYVRGSENMYKYIKKGYQVQEIADGGNANEWDHMFLMVKY